VQQSLQAVSKKVEVLKESEDAQIAADAEEQKKPFSVRCDCLVNHGATDKINGSRKEYQPQTSPVPAPIKDVACQKEDAVLPPVAAGQIQAVDDSKKKGKLQCVKQHAKSFLLSAQPETTDGMHLCLYRCVVCLGAGEDQCVPWPGTGAQESLKMVWREWLRLKAISVDDEPHDTGDVLMPRAGAHCKKPSGNMESVCPDCLGI